MADSSWDAARKFEPQKMDEEMEFFIELALHETQRWIQLLSRQKFKYDDDPRASLQDGTLLCLLVNALRPDTIRKINRLPTPIAGLDNINVFLEACRKHFGLQDSQLFSACDLEDPTRRRDFESEEELRFEVDRKLRGVAVTVFWLGKNARKWFEGPHLDLSAFTDLVHQSAPSIASTSSLASTPSRAPSTPEPRAFSPAELSSPKSVSPELTASPVLASESASSRTGHKRQESGESLDQSSAYGSIRSDTKNSQSSELQDHEDLGKHMRDDSYDSLISEDNSCAVSFGEDKGGEHHVHYEPAVEDNDDMPSRFNTRQSNWANKPASAGGGGGGGSDELRYSASHDATYSHRDDQHTDYHHQADDREEYTRFRFADTPTGSNASSTENLHRISGAGAQSSKHGDYVPPTRALLHQTSTTAYDPLQFIKGRGTQRMAKEAETTVKVMEAQKHVKQTVQMEEEDWQSNLSNWKQKMRTKSTGSFQRSMDASDVETQEKEAAASRRPNKTFKEMMQDRENRKSGGFMYSSMDADEEDVFKEIKTQAKSRATDEEKLSAFGFTKAEPEDVAPKPATSSRASWRTYPREDSPSSSPATKQYGVVRTTASSSPGRTLVQQKKTEEETEEVVERVARRTERLWSWERKKSEEEQDEPKEEVPSWAQSSDTEKRNSQVKTENAQATDSHRENGVIACERSAPLPAERQQLDMLEAKPGAFKTRHTDNEGSARVFPQTQVFNSEHSEETTHTVVNRPWMIKPRNPTQSSVQNTKSMFETETGVTRTEIPVEHIHSSGDGNFAKWKAPEVFSGEESRREVRGGREVPVSSPTEQKSWRNEPHARSSFVQGEEEEEEDSIQQEYVEKIIKISQKPNSDKGFGFTIRGGKEFAQPVTVDKVTLGDTEGSAADVCELMTGDEIVAVNGAEVANHYQGSVMHVITQAVITGSIELLIRRRHDKDLDDSFEAEQLKVTQTSPIGIRHKQQQQQQQQPGSWQQQQTDNNQQPIYVSHQSSPDEDDQPPPLPAAPPPAPNWSTFPGSTPLSTDLSTDFDDTSDFLPDTSQAADSSPPSTSASVLRRSPEKASRLQKQDPRLDALRRRSEFLGINLEEMEEYKKLQAEETEKVKEKTVPAETRPTSSILEDFRKSSVDPPLYGEIQSRSYHHRSDYELEEQERRIIQNLEREEQQKAEQERREEVERKKQEKVRAWKSMEHLQSSQPSAVDIDIEDRVTRDMESTYSNRPQSDIKSSHRFLDLEHEKRRMKEWSEQQEKKLQDDPANYQHDVNYSQQKQFILDQDKMKKDHDETMKHVKQREDERRKQEEVMLGPELERQRQLEELRKTQNEQRKKLQEAEERRLREQEVIEDRRRQLEQEDIRWQEAEKRRYRELQEQQELERQKVRHERQQEEMRAVSGYSLSAQHQTTDHIWEERQREEEQRRDDERREEQRQQAEREAQRHLKEEQERKEKELQAREDERRETERRQKEEEARRREEEAKKLAEKEMELRKKEEEIARAQQLLQRDRELLEQERRVPPSVDWQQQQHSSPLQQRPASWSSLPHPPQPAPAQTRMIESPAYSSLEVASSPSTPPGPRKPLKKEPPIPAKRSIKTELMQPKSLNVQTSTSQQEMAYSRPVLHAKPAPSEAISRDDVLRMNRQHAAGHRQDWHRPHSHAESEPPPLSPTQHPINRRSLHNLSAPPKPRYMQEGEWIVPKDERQKQEDQRRHQRHTEIMQTTIGNTSQHWVVEEAERRRLAESSGRERLQKLQNRQAQRQQEALAAQQAGSPASTQGLEAHNYTHSLSPQSHMQSPRSPHPQPSQSHMHSPNVHPQSPQQPVPKAWDQPPDTYSKQHGPIPNSIKQTLINRVTPPREPTYPYTMPSSSYSMPDLHNVTSPQGSWVTSPSYTSPQHSYPSNRSYPSQESYSISQKDNSRSMTESSHGTASSPSTTLYSSQPNSSYLPNSSYNSPPPVTYSQQVYGSPPNQPPPPSQYSYRMPTHTGSNTHSQQTPLSYSKSVPYTGAPPHANHTDQSHGAFHLHTDSQASSGSDRAPPVPPKPPRLLSTSSDDSHAEMTTVSGSEHCATCQHQLGYGAAMVIQSLGLHYHLECFNCCVCRLPLGGPSGGADVRVRQTRLHCPNCYSNDEVGLKFSKV